MADRQYEILMKKISDFESELNDDEEITLLLASFGQTITMHVRSIGYNNPVLIHFYGSVDGHDAQLTQHVSQLSFLMIATPKLDTQKPANRIGFIKDDDPTLPDDSSAE